MSVINVLFEVGTTLAIELRETPLPPIALTRSSTERVEMLWM